MPHATTTTTPPLSEEEELHLSTQEALTCTTCAITHIPKTIFHRDQTTGIYNTSRSPPFQVTSGTWIPREEEHLAPEEMPTSSLSSVNYDHQDNDNNHDNDDTTPPHPPHDPTHDRHPSDPFTRYQLAYHIHIHYLLRRGVLSLCRDVKDVYELKAWRGKIHEMDMRQPREEKEGVGWQTRSRMGWVNDGNLLMVYQMALWRKRGAGRLKRVEESRARWAGIVEERRRQRQKQRGSVRVRVYCSQAGDRCLLREVEMDEVGEKIR
ncbi:uncharacterized protein BO80DRAFT_503705 [Aspergillus ibericus CBS 121593]|uniref:Uncharacterized protein n=1 Tax=Aspergillus ibericus CBS 121593 TaxID=1448316 RepID=A0A395GXZ4_9EURO|nr:hypothetical protein BO80DRAFT_503705 [Aspergillus ibericus CBS 121593]RAK98923.1 hypothetical protein BO80DRAFT_503705 [Aspergillus ibericus CBS 121593]